METGTRRNILDLGFFQNRKIFVLSQIWIQRTLCRSLYNTLGLLHRRNIWKIRMNFPMKYHTRGSKKNCFSLEFFYIIIARRVNEPIITWSRYWLWYFYLTHWILFFISLLFLFIWIWYWFVAWKFDTKKRITFSKLFYLNLFSTKNTSIIGMTNL